MRLLAVALLAAACGSPPDPSAAAGSAPAAHAPRQLGSWTGRGSTTLGFASESGSFRIEWKTRSDTAGQSGRFLLTLRSGISGRPIQVIADHEGTGAGGVEFGDDPRLYEFLVESSGVEWTISVQETFAPRK
jgi:outer membrane biogenesis lipoprotein LolB